MIWDDFSVCLWSGVLEVRGLDKWSNSLRKVVNIYSCPDKTDILKYKIFLILIKFCISLVPMQSPHTDVCYLN